MDRTKPGGLPDWYKDNVVGGPGSFLQVAQDFNTFVAAITNKLLSEVANVAGRSAARDD